MCTGLESLKLYFTLTFLSEGLSSKNPRDPRELVLRTNLRRQRRRVVANEATVKPAEAPGPRIVAPIEAENATRTIRATKNCPFTKDVGGVASGLLLETFRNEMFVVPECEEYPGIEANQIFHHPEALEPILAYNGSLVTFESCLQLKRGEVKLSESKRT